MENYKQLCVMQATELGDGTKKEFVEFFKEKLNIRVKFEAAILTLPDLDSNNQPVSETGGRSDLFFYVHADDVIKFAIPRLEMGIRWWEDVIKYNDNSHLYTNEFINAHPVTW